MTCSRRDPKYSHEVWEQVICRVCLFKLKLEWLLMQFCVLCVRVCVCVWELAWTCMFRQQNYYRHHRIETKSWCLQINGCWVVFTRRAAMCCNTGFPLLIVPWSNCLSLNADCMIVHGILLAWSMLITANKVLGSTHYPAWHQRRTQMDPVNPPAPR